MLLKGIVSAVYMDSKTAEVTLPEYDNAVTGKLPFYRQSASVGQFVVVAVFGTDWNDGVIL